MAAPTETGSAQASARAEGETLVVSLAGTWRIIAPRPSWAEVLAQRSPRRVRLAVDAAGSWDSSLVLFLFEAQQWCRATGAQADIEGLPEKLRTLLAQMAASHETSLPRDRSENFFQVVGLATLDAGLKLRAIFRFVGECVIALVQLVKKPHKFRWADCLDEMQQCGAMALPIVSLISFLVGVTLAYTGALVLRQYGGDIYVADLIGLAMVREMGAMMTGVVLAGRTGAAFAATIGNMKANEEIDALETLGIPAVNFLVLPRMLALGVMMPLLALYANALGILGGMAVSKSVLEISPTAYWVEMLTIVSLGDVAVGAIKAIAFGLIVGLSGCLCGLQAERSAAGVGRAATSAVVTAILFIIVADALFAVAFNVIGL
jgi:phospholipid/cholesterol/gamma-HCH transport system permease protein